MVETPDDWRGDWGVILAATRCTTLTLVVGAGDSAMHWGIPYSGMARWIFKARPESIEIQGAGLTVSVRGRGLRRLFDAIGEQRLLRMCEQHLDAKEHDGIFILAITVGVEK